jgi:hypothetical protein
MSMQSNALSRGNGSSQTIISLFIALVVVILFWLIA